jgi:hypothetical protein
MTTDIVDHRLNQLEVRVGSVEGHMGDVRVGLERLHSDLKLNTSTTQHVQNAVEKIADDTGDMVSLMKGLKSIGKILAWVGIPVTLIAGVISLLHL